MVVGNYNEIQREGVRIAVDNGGGRERERVDTLNNNGCP